MSRMSISSQERKKNKRNASSRRAGGMGSRLVRSVHTQIGGVPDELDVVLRYNEIINLSSTVAQVGYVFRGNDTFDPNFTGTGSQPAYRDNWAALYVVQQVVSSTITIRPFHDSSTASAPGVFIAAPSWTSTLNDVDYVRSLPGSQSRVLNYYAPPAPVTITRSTAQMNAVAMVRNQGVGSAVVGATPADPWFWLLIQRTADGASTCSCDYEVTIDYHVHFSERVPSGLSLEHAMKNREAFKAAQARKPQGRVFVQLPVERKDPPRPIRESEQVSGPPSEEKKSSAEEQKAPSPAAGRAAVTEEYELVSLPTRQTPRCSPALLRRA